ncbi:MAG: tetratricopeptide repeat protein [Blastocatellia bacterium]
MKRRAFAFCLALLSATILSFNVKPGSSVAAKETWTGVKSKHFYLTGNAGEKDIRKVAAKMEQFREVFSRLFPRANLNSPVPIKVIVFKNRKSYQPFMPVYEGKVSEVAGYFQSGPDVNYITLTAELGQESPFSTIFHEYVHSLTNDNTYSAPPWFSEGLAEFYSTFDVTDGEKKVWLGKPISHHVYLLRENKFLPLQRLFAVDHDSPEYNERDKKGVFYAQSWALVHFLMLGNNSQRQPQLVKYLGMLANGVPVDESFKQAFQTDYATMEKELKNYIGRNTYPVQTFMFDQKLQFDAAMESAPITEAEWNYHLGDLVLHINRTDCEQYLKKALQLDPNLAVAHASLGIAQMRGQRFAEAKQSLERAVATGSQNHMAHYYYAYVLSREGMDESNMIREYAPEVARKMREHLKKAIAISPGFPESYNLLAFVNMVTGEELDESASLLRRAISLSPGRHEFVFMLAQIQMRQQKYDEAHKMLEPVAKNAPDPELRQRAQSLLESIKSITERLEQFKAETEAANTRQVTTGTGAKTGENVERPRIPLRRRFEGEKARGLLTEIQCSEKGLTLVIKDGERTLKFNTGAPEQLQFVAYSQDTGQSINCGKVNPARSVIVTYRGSTDAKSPFNGEPIAVEFVKQEEK